MSDEAVLLEMNDHIGHAIGGGYWNPWATAELDAHLPSRTDEMADAREGVAALLAKRKPVFKGR